MIPDMKCSLMLALYDIIITIDLKEKGSANPMGEYSSDAAKDVVS